MELNTFELEGNLLSHSGYEGYKSVGYEIPGHKYKLRIRMPDGQYRYFYTEKEIDAYYHNQRRDLQAKNEGRSRPKDGRVDEHTTVKKESEFEGRSRPSDYNIDMTRVHLSAPSGVKDAKKQYQQAKQEENKVHKDYGYIEPPGKVQMAASKNEQGIVREAEAKTQLAKNLLDEEKKKRRNKFLFATKKFVEHL